MNAVDTNIFVYAIDSSDPVRQSHAEKFLDGLAPSDTIMPWQVACEIAAVLHRLKNAGKLSGDLGTIVNAARSRFRIVLPQHSTLDRALRIASDEQVSPWDALLIAACADAGVTRLFTEDLQSRPEIHGVAIVNPFA